MARPAAGTGKDSWGDLSMPFNSWLILIGVRGLRFWSLGWEESMVPHPESEAWATPGASVRGSDHVGLAGELEVRPLISGQGFQSQRKI